MCLRYTLIILLASSLALGCGEDSSGTAASQGDVQVQDRDMLPGDDVAVSLDADRETEEVSDTLSNDEVDAVDVGDVVDLAEPGDVAAQTDQSDRGDSADPRDLTAPGDLTDQVDLADSSDIAPDQIDDPRAESATFTIASWNANYNNSVSNVVQHTKQVINADVVGFQELGNLNHATSIIEKLAAIEGGKNCSACEYRAYFPTAGRSYPTAIIWRKSKFKRVQIFSAASNLQDIGHLRRWGVCIEAQPGYV